MERFRQYSPMLKKLAFPAAAALLIALALGRHLFSALMLVLGSAAAAFVLEPLSRLYEKRLPRGLSALLALASFAAIGLMLLTALTPVFIDMLSRLIMTADSLADIFSGFLARLEKYGISPASASGYLTRLTARAAGALAGLSGSAAAIGAGAVLCFFMLRDRENVLLRAELLLPRSIRGAVTRSCASAARELRMFLRGQLIISGCVAALSAFGLIIVGVPGGLGLGLLSGLLNIIPYLGPALAILPVIASSITVGLPCALLAVVVLLAVQQIDGLIISPRVLGDATGMSPALIVLVLYVMGAAWGVGGMLAALPAMIIARTCYRVFVETTSGD